MCGFSCECEQHGCSVVSLRINSQQINSLTQMVRKMAIVILVLRENNANENTLYDNEQKKRCVLIGDGSREACRQFRELDRESGDIVFATTTLTMRRLKWECLKTPSGNIRRATNCGDPITLTKDVRNVFQAGSYTRPWLEFLYLKVCANLQVKISTSEHSIGLYTASEQSKNYLLATSSFA